MIYLLVGKICIGGAQGGDQAFLAEACADFINKITGRYLEGHRSLVEFLEALGLCAKVFLSFGNALSILRYEGVVRRGIAALFEE